MSDSRFYRHSGKVTLQGIAFGSVASLVGAPLLGVTYAFATYYIPSIYLNALLTALFGVAIGFGVGYAMRSGHVRNTAVTAIAALTGAVVAHYVGWMTWVAIVLRDVPDVSAVAVLNPLFLVDAVFQIADVGAWSFHSEPVKGTALWVIWSIEALMVFGATLFGAFGAASSAPYCERCGRWCKSIPAPVRLVVGANTDDLVRRVEQHDLGALAELRNAEPHAIEWMEVEIEACDGCGGTNALSLSRVKLGKDSKGNEKREEDQLLHRLLVSPEQVASIRGLASRVAESQVAASV